MTKEENREKLKEIMGTPETVAEIVAAYLEAAGYDGLVHPSREIDGTRCCCELTAGDIAACSDPQDQCVAGVYRNCTECSQSELDECDQRECIKRIDE